MRLYVLHPGSVQSKCDGQWHHVGAGQLAKLYGVRVADCVIADEHGEVRGVDVSKLMHLWPKYSGDYTAPILRAQVRRGR